ncbi:hypothetical protein EXE46_08020 [Halorubrum sp. GN11_10-6_MGM]|uniref:hypothetical protein n=1 Tax=Halorubrum sp. GN11_10-6_MGM TaxID=2518112 RepID=UPI0010F9CF69|nr:hypothetical protein [Halorubrum sp. GN11_10-6_MGM]TKX74638.1 hypothetical protein EXE46_08020 [Halorubrum sp. GN11_10-6_MGM]
MSDLAVTPDNGTAPESAESVPETVVYRDQWICWRYEQGGDKKPPYDPEAGEKASTKEPETWSDFETAIKTYQAGDYDGVGIVLTEDDPIVGIDFDYCRDPKTGDIESEIRHIIESIDSYTEVSPSGTGLHTVVIGEKPENTGSRSGDGIEVYDSEQYFTFTGDHLGSTPETIEERNEELQEVCREHLITTRTDRDDAIGELPDDDPDEDAITQAQDYIREFIHDQKTGPRAREYYTDLLKGRYAKRGFKDDRSGAETTLCSLTYGILLDRDANPANARNLTYHYVNNAIAENPRTEKRRDLRKWIEGTPNQQRNYRQNTLNYALQNFDSEIWNYWRRSGKDESTNDYCEHAYEVTLDSLYSLTMECDLFEPPPTCLLIIPQRTVGLRAIPAPTRRWQKSASERRKSTN